MIPLEVCLSTDPHKDLQTNLKLLAKLDVARVELCAAMCQQGLTPTPEQIKLAREQLNSRQTLLVMIRPRPGSFHYSTQELLLMQQQISEAADLGADGVVLGALDAQQSTIAMNAMEKLIASAQDRRLEITFHRAFDALDNKTLALSQIQQLDIHRLLTSGGKWQSQGTVLEALPQLQQLLLQLDNKLELVVAGGVNANIAVPIVQALKSIGQRFSLHSYSGVLTGTVLDKLKLQNLLAICQGENTASLMDRNTGLAD